MFSANDAKMQICLDIIKILIIINKQCLLNKSTCEISVMFNILKKKKRLKFKNIFFLIPQCDNQQSMCDHFYV